MRIFVKHLCDLADIIRKTFFDGYRRSDLHPSSGSHRSCYGIFDDKTRSIDVCINRFDDETKRAFVELYDKVDGDFDYTASGEQIDTEEVA